MITGLIPESFESFFADIMSKLQTTLVVVGIVGVLSIYGGEKVVAVIMFWKISNVDARFYSFPTIMRLDHNLPTTTLLYNYENRNYMIYIISII